MSTPLQVACYRYSSTTRVLGYCCTTGTGTCIARLELSRLWHTQSVYVHGLEYALELTYRYMPSHASVAQCLPACLPACLHPCTPDCNINTGIGTRSAGLVLQVRLVVCCKQKLEHSKCTCTYPVAYMGHFNVYAHRVHVYSS